MTIIFLLFLVLAIFLSGFGWSEKLRKINAPLSWFFIYIFSVLLGFRSKYSGMDTISYYNYFNDLASRHKPDFKFEFGFKYFTYLMTQITTAEAYIFSLSFILIYCLYIASRLLNILNRLFCIILFIAFLPGLDMLTNGVRGGLALTVGLIILVPTVINNNKLAVLNFFPMLLHSSYGIIALISLFVKKFSNPKTNTLLFISSLFFFIIWLIIKPDSILSLIEGHSRQVNVIGKLIRYLILERELLSLSVKLYFMLICLIFSSIYFFTLKINKDARQDEPLTRMAFIILAGQLIYALFSFSQFSYRFMFLVYPLQILMTGYVIDKYFSGMQRNILVFSLCFLGIITTYTTRNFLQYNLLNL